MTAKEILTQIHQFISTPLYSVAGTPVTIGRVLVALLALLGAWFISFLQPHCIQSYKKMEPASFGGKRKLAENPSPGRCCSSWGTSPGGRVTVVMLPGKKEAECLGFRPIRQLGKWYFNRHGCSACIDSGNGDGICSPARNNAYNTP